MKRKSLLFLLLFALMAPWAAQAQEIVTIGDGTTNNYNTPIGTYYNYSITEQLYTAAEIGMAGAISSISFNYAGTSAKDFTITVYMKNVEATDLSTGISLADAEIVFDGTLSVTGAGWATITLDDAFAYDGVSNLLIGFKKDAPSWFSGGRWYYTEASNMARYSSQDGTTPYTISTVPATATNQRPNIQIEITPGEGPCCPKPKVTVDEVASNSITFHWDGNGECQYTVYNATTNTQVFSESGINNPKTITGLAPLTDYRLEVKAYCPDCEEQYSDVVTKTFTTTAVATEVGDAWTDDFEGNACGWELINGELANAWVWGTAANNGGTHGLYVSNDNGTTNAYTLTTAATVYATKFLHFTEGKFEFSFDWKANGEANTNSVYDYLRVALVPASVTLTASTNVPTGFSSTALPSGWIAVDGGSYLNGISTWQNQSAAANVTTGNYYLVMVWRNDGSQGNQPPAAIDNVSITRMACTYDVTGLNVKDITSNGATLAWANSEVGQWKVAYADNAGFEHATEEIVNDTSYNITGLQPATKYYAKVRAYCGGNDFGAWSAVVDFYTDCVIIPALGYTENFDSYTAGVGMLPLCWNKINTTSNTTYQGYPRIYNYSSQSSPNCLYFYSYYSSYGSYDPQDQYAILPEMENLAGKQITLSAKANNTTVTFKIGTMTDPADAATFTEFATQALTTSYQEFEYIVPADATGHYLAIMMEAASSSSTSRYVYVDDISIGEAPSCYKPKGLVASNPTAHGATLNWNLNDPTQTAWDVQVSDTVDFSRVVLLDENVDVHQNYVLSNRDLINPETLYYVRVRGNCGSGDVSEWSNTASFTTTIACPAPTGFAATEIYGYSAKLNWTGYSESYTVSYRTAAYTDGVGEGFGTSLPSGWENKTGLLSDIMNGGAWGTTSQWYFGTSNGVFDAHARINIYGSGTTGRQGWLITPEFTVSQGASTLTFDLALTAFSGSAVPAPETTGTDDKFVVLISTDNEATWTILRQWDNAEGSTYVYNNIANTATGEQVSFDLSSYVGQSVRIAFYGESTVSNADNNLHIDNVHCGIDHEAGAWQTVPSDTTMVVLTPLVPETAYEAKVQGDCSEDGLSEETSILSFTTIDACPVPTGLTVVDSLLTATSAYLKWNGSPDVDAFTVRYRVPEHVENGVSETFGTSLPLGWENKQGLLEYVMNDSIELSSGSQWVFGSNNGVFDNHARINIYGPSIRGWLITPAFTLASSTFTFDLALTAYSGSAVPAPATTGTDDKFVVLISTDNEASWTILRQWDNAEGSTYVYNDIANTATGEQVSIDLSAYVGQKVRIAFYGESTTSNADNNLHIDNVLIGNPTTIPTSDWLTAGSETTNVTLTSLNPETTYEAQVKSDCSDPEEWSTAINFTTPQQTILTQTVALTAGTNWFSTYLEITLGDLQTALRAALPGVNTGITIKAKVGNSTFRNGNWRNVGGFVWDVAKMYRIEVPADCEITLTGDPINPADHEITILAGEATWIGFPFSESMDPADVIPAGFAVNGDQIKGKEGNFRYTNRWRPTGINALEPGKGYMYVPAQTVTEDRILIYSNNAK